MQDLYQIHITRFGEQVLSSTKIDYAAVQQVKCLMINTDSSFKFTVLNLQTGKETLL